MNAPSSNFLEVLYDKTRAVTPGPNVVDANVLDARYCYEVQRVRPYIGNLVVFDADDDFKVLLEEEVDISFDALFGNHIDDRIAHQARVVKFVDEELIK